MPKFKIPVQNTITKENSIREVVGEHILIGDLNCFIFIDPEETPQGTVEGWNISELQTGMRMASDLSKERCIEKATYNYTTWPQCIQKGFEIMSEQGFEIPLNKL